MTDRTRISIFLRALQATLLPLVTVLTAAVEHAPRSLLKNRVRNGSSENRHKGQANVNYGARGEKMTTVGTD